MMRVACGFLVLLTCEAAGTWQYGDSTTTTCGATITDKCGPVAWKKNYAACAGTGDQSPINAIVKTPEHLAGSALTDLKLVARACAKASFQVNMHTFEVETATTCPGAFTATWKGKDYDLTQYNYHTPSEHTLDGAYFPMEVHHVHTAADKSTLVIAVFVSADKSLEAKCPATVTTVECTRARFFQALLAGGPSVATVKAATTALVGGGAKLAQVTEAATLTTKTFDPYNAVTGFIPPMDKYFFQYVGSFTTPPCTTGVTWILNPTAVTIFDSSLVLFRQLINAFPNNQLKVTTSPWGAEPVAFTWDVAIGTNNRAIQELGARKFYYVGTLPPWDSSVSSGSGTSFDSSASLSTSSESDSSGSYTSSGSAASGSSGSFMAIWKWLLLATLLLCCCIAAIAAAMKKKPVKKKKPTPAPAPAPEPEPVVEPLLPPLMPMTTAMPMTTMSYAAPATTAYAMPMTTSYAAPAAYATPYAYAPAAVV